MVSLAAGLELTKPCLNQQVQRSLRVEVHTPRSDPLASVVSNPLYKWYIPLLGRGVCASAGLLGSFVQAVCKRGMRKHPWMMGWLGGVTPAN